MARTKSSSRVQKRGRDKLGDGIAPPTPGAVLRKFLIGENKISQELLADALRVSRVTVNQLINGRQAVTAEMALRLARALSTTPELWLTLQRDVDLEIARQQLAGELLRVKVVRKPLNKRELFYELE